MLSLSDLALLGLTFDVDLGPHPPPPGSPVPSFSPTGKQIKTLTSSYAQIRSNPTSRNVSRHKLDRCYCPICNDRKNPYSFQQVHAGVLTALLRGGIKLGDPLWRGGWCRGSLCEARTVKCITSQTYQSFPHIESAVCRINPNDRSNVFISGDGITVGFVMGASIWEWLYDLIAGLWVVRTRMYSITCAPHKNRRAEALTVPHLPVGGWWHVGLFHDEPRCRLVGWLTRSTVWIPQVVTVSSFLRVTRHFILTMSIYVEHTVS